MILPLLLSVPHAGLWVPPEARPYCILTERDIAEDGDAGAAAIYALASDVAAFVTTEVARAIVDMNRAPDDRRPDGVVKTHTCWNVPVYREFPPDTVVDRLLERYYRPYHAQLSQLAQGDIRLGVDCHTMAAEGPPIGPGAGVERPRVCISNADGTCPRPWIDRLASCFTREFGPQVSINHPFQGGFTIRSHARELPWIQLELSRGPFLSDPEKREGVRAALSAWREAIG